MRIGALRGHATPRGSGDKSLLQEIRFVNITDGVSFLRNRGGERFQADRTTVELVDDRGPELQRGSPRGFGLTFN